MTEPASEHGLDSECPQYSFSHPYRRLLSCLGAAAHCNNTCVPETHALKPARFVDVREVNGRRLHHPLEVQTWGSIPDSDEAIRFVGDAELSGPVKNSWGIPLTGTFAMVVINDEFLHHRGQLYTYVRACGGEPPFMWGFEENPEGFRPEHPVG